MDVRYKLGVWNSGTLRLKVACVDSEHAFLSSNYIRASVLT